MKDYKKLYEEAFERAKSIRFGNPQSGTANVVCEEIFPELRESEDERMLKEFNDYLCEEIEARINDIRDEKDRRTLNMLCYVLTKVKDRLEKQKESLHVQETCKENADSFTDKLEDEKIRKALIYDIERLPIQGILTHRPTSEYIAYLERQKEQKHTESGVTNNESEYDKGYREGHKFGLKQNEEYMLPGGRTFSGLIPCWVNAPSTLQPAHKYHGKNLIVMHENNGGFRCCCIDNEKPVTFHLPEDTYLVEGWNKKPAEWSEEDKIILAQIHLLINDARSNGKIDNTMALDMRETLKSLRPQPHWKPSRGQMSMLLAVINEPNNASSESCHLALAELYDELKKL